MVVVMLVCLRAEGRMWGRGGWNEDKEQGDDKDQRT
jgi:hypothetical protein